MYSKILVGVQFTMILIIVLFGTFPASIVAIAISSGGLLLGFVSIITMRLDNVRILPEPKKGIRLVTRGPYRILRHPMYTSVLLSTIPFLHHPASPTIYLSWLLLLAALLAKIQIEERLLPTVLPEYDHYRNHTWRLIPFIY